MAPRRPIGFSCFEFRQHRGAFDFEAQPLIFYSGRYKQLHAHEPSAHFDDVLESW